MPVYDSLTDVLHLAVKSAPSGRTAISVAALIGKPYPTLMSELSDQPGHKLVANLILPIINATNSNEPIHWLCRQRGGLFLQLPDPAQGAGELVQALAVSIKEFGDFATEVAEDISDGLIPRHQLDRIQKEGHEAMESIMALLKLASITHEAQYGRPGGKDASCK